MMTSNGEAVPKATESPTCKLKFFVDPTTIFIQRWTRDKSYEKYLSGQPLNKCFRRKYKMPCITTHKMVSNKTFLRQLSIQNIFTCKMMMQCGVSFLSLLRDWLKLSRDSSLSLSIQLHMFSCMRVSDMFIQFGLTLWEVGVMGVDSSGIPVSYEWCI